MFCIGLQTAHKAYVYPQFENFSNQVFWELYEIEKNTRKINALSKKRSFYNVI